MEELNLHDLKDRINDDTTKEYFDEVLSSYYHGNYRASIVGLYSVVICDVVYKLIYLRDMYSDVQAKTILDDIKAKQLANPTSANWETFLIDQTEKNTNVINPILKNDIEFLKKHRHLSAHPVISDTNKSTTI